MSGREAADCICTQLALTNWAEEGGAWSAWLSTTTEDAKDHIGMEGQPYVLRNGNQVAASGEALLDWATTPLDNPIDVDEQGNDGISEYVWTATRATGLIYTDADEGTCSDWTSSGSIFARAGRTNTTNYYWTNYTAQSCSMARRIYCFKDTATPTAVQLVTFLAEPRTSHAIVVSWETASEIDNAGFHLWRSEGAQGPYIRITETLIPAEGSPVQGAQYSYEDTGINPGAAYWYKLEDFDFAGVSTFHGPVKAEADVSWDVPEAEASALDTVDRTASKGTGTAVMFIPALAAVVLLRRHRRRRHLGR